MTGPIDRVGGVSSVTPVQSHTRPAGKKKDEVQTPEPVAGEVEMEDVDPGEEEAEQEQEVEADGIQNEDLVLGDILPGNDRKPDPRYGKRVRPVGKDGGGAMASQLMARPGVLSSDEAQALLAGHKGFWDEIVEKPHVLERPGMLDLKAALVKHAGHEELSVLEMHTIRHAKEILSAYKGALEVGQDGARLSLPGAFSHTPPVSHYPSSLLNNIIRSQEGAVQDFRSGGRALRTVDAVQEMLQNMLRGRGRGRYDGR